MLRAVIIGANATSRDLLNAVLTNGGHQVVGATHSTAQGFALLQNHHPHMVCIAEGQVEDGHAIVEQIRTTMPKMMIFMVSGELDETTVHAAAARGVQGFIAKPFMADVVLKTIKSTVLEMIRKQQGSAA